MQRDHILFSLHHWVLMGADSSDTDLSSPARREDSRWDRQEAEVSPWDGGSGLCPPREPTFTPASALYWTQWDPELPEHLLPALTA